jgi:hypothetical protein
LPIWVIPDLGSGYCQALNRKLGRQNKAGCCRTDELAAHPLISFVWQRFVIRFPQNNRRERENGAFRHERS